MFTYAPGRRQPIPHRHSPAHERDVAALGLAARLAAAGAATRTLRTLLAALPRRRPHIAQQPPDSYAPEQRE